jgi:hypothetical protein
MILRRHGRASGAKRRLGGYYPGHPDARCTDYRDARHKAGHDAVHFAESQP